MCANCYNTEARDKIKMAIYVFPTLPLPYLFRNYALFIIFPQQVLRQLHSLLVTPLPVSCQTWATPPLPTSDLSTPFPALQQPQVLCRLPSQVSLPWLPTLPPSRTMLMLLMLLLLLLPLCVAQCDTNPARWVWLSRWSGVPAILMQSQTCVCYSIHWVQLAFLGYISSYLITHDGKTKIKLCI